jgi:molybdopterin-guanine dinucleotide biosynthesis protein A
VNDPLGVVLAGGQGKRMGASKATVKLAGRPLISYALEAVWRALGNVAVVAKRHSELPALPGVPLWIEPDEPCHPLTGIVHALRQGQDRPVLVCAVDLPLVSPELIRAIAGTDPGAAAVVARHGARLQPTLARYGPAALSRLAAALGGEPGCPLTDTVRSISPKIVEVASPDALFNVNSPADLLKAAALLERRGALQPNVKS